MEYLATNVSPKRLIINEISIIKSPFPRFRNLKNAQNAPKIFLKMHQKNYKRHEFHLFMLFFPVLGERLNAVKNLHTDLFLKDCCE